MTDTPDLRAARLRPQRAAWRIRLAPAGALALLGFAAVALAESGVDCPRHHVVERDTVLVAGQLGAATTTIIGGVLVIVLTLLASAAVPAFARYRVSRA